MRRFDDIVARIIVMLMVVGIVVIIVFVTGCGVESQVRTAIDPDVQVVPTYKNKKYTMADHDTEFDQYLTHFPKNSGSIPIVFNEITSMGRCYMWNDGTGEIEIDPTKWSKLSKLQRTLLIWHEMYHCEYQSLVHNNKTIMPDDTICTGVDGNYDLCDMGQPLSIMNWWLMRDRMIVDMCAQTPVDDITELFCKHRPAAVIVIIGGNS